MLKTRFILPGQAEHDRIAALLPTFFPKEELPPEGVVDQPLPYLCFYDDGEFIGFAEVFKTPKLHYLKYMAMLPQYRSQGYGGKMLDLILAERKNVPLALDIEELDENAANYEQRVRRFRFYRKHGMVDTGYALLYRNSAYTILSTGEADVPGIMQNFFDHDPHHTPGYCRVVKRDHPEKLFPRNAEKHIL